MSAFEISRSRLLSNLIAALPALSQSPAVEEIVDFLFAKGYLVEPAETDIDADADRLYRVYPDRKIDAIKALRETRPLSIKEAKDAIDKAQRRWEAIGHETMRAELRQANLSTDEVLGSLE